MFTMDDWKVWLTTDGSAGFWIAVALCVLVYAVLWIVGCVERSKRPPPLSETDIAAAKVLSDAIERLPLVLHTHDLSKSLIADEARAMLPTLGDMSIGFVQPPDPLDTIIIDMGRVIESEHLEIRARNRFAAILNRLENYRDS